MGDSSQGLIRANAHMLIHTHASSFFPSHSVCQGCAKGSRDELLQPVTQSVVCLPLQLNTTSASSSQPCLKERRGQKVEGEATSGITLFKSHVSILKNRQTIHTLVGL